MVIKHQTEKGNDPGKISRQNLFFLSIVLAFKVQFLWPFKAGIICDNSYCVDVMVDMFP